jgi:hypothetical protein
MAFTLLHENLIASRLFVQFCLVAMRAINEIAGL